MSEDPTETPWQMLERLVATGSRQSVEAFVDGLTSKETARAFSRLDSETQAQLLSLLEPAEAADVIEEIAETQAVEVIAELPPPEAAAIVDELRSDEQADLLGEMPVEDSDAILEQMPAPEAANIRQLMEYAADTAGGLMVTEYLSYGESRSVADVVDDMRQMSDVYSDYDVQYSYVTDAGGALVGVLPVRDLLLSHNDRLISAIMVSPPLSVRDDTPLDELQAFFEDHPFLGAPVVDAGGHLVGVVHRSAVDAATEKQADRTYLESSGIVGGEELRSMSLYVRSSRRLSWLSVNILLNIIAASVIAAYQDTLTAVIALAVFLPIISDMSGCSGNQAVAVSIRELTLGLVQPRELFRVLWQECKVGIVNGFVLGVLLGVAAWLWQGNPFLGLVVACALGANTVVAVCIGGLVPLALKGLGKDPALASGPILTTVTDMCGFFLVLSLATLMLARLAV